MKNKFLVFLLFTLLLSFSIVFDVNAAGKTLSQIEYMYDAEEFNEISRVLNLNTENEKSDTVSAEASSLLSPYKMYSVSADVFLELSDNPDKINEIISGDYIWIVADEQGKVNKIGKIDKKWQILGYSTLADKKEQSMVTQARYVNNIIVVQKGTAITSDNSAEIYICFEVPQYHTSFLGVFSDNDAVIVPFGNRPDLTGLENGKEYSIKEVAELFADNTLMTDTDANGGIGSYLSETQNDSDNSYGMDSTVAALLIILSVLAVSAIVIIIFRKKKKL